VQQDVVCWRRRLVAASIKVVNGMLKSVPNRDQFLALAAHPNEGPLVVLNLLRFESQVPREGGGTETGFEAYSRYSEVARAHIEGLGGRVLWQGKPRFHLVGGERWDLVALVEYPTALAFMEMQDDAAYRESLRHRDRGLADTRVVACLTIDSRLAAP
jgi:uncharacterized protein (DUF1330 family)